MYYQKVRSINEYQQLIAYLRPKGPYQIKLLTCLTLYWLLSGFNQAMFQLSVAWQQTESQFIIQQITQIAVILTTSYISLYFSRYLTNFVTIILLVIGAIILSIGAEIENGETEQVGIFFVCTLHYSLAFNILMIVLQFFPTSAYAFIWMLSMGGFTIGKMVSVSVFSSDMSVQSISLFILLPCCVVYIFSLILYSESPRYLIDHDINKAENLLKIISDANGLRHQSFTFMLQRQFFWNKVSLKKYSFATFFKFKSISYNTWMLCACCILLGVICRCPDFIQHIQSQTSFQVEDSVEIIWISTFQLCGLFPSYISASVIRRKALTIALSIVLLIISALLVCLDQANFFMGDAILYSMAIFGLSSFFSMAMFYFLILTAIQFYPHTIRTLALGIIICSYKLGKMLFSLHIEFIQDYSLSNAVMLELVVACSILLLFHSFLLKETLHQPGKYQILQIEQKEIDDD